MWKKTLFILIAVAGLLAGCGAKEPVAESGTGESATVQKAEAPVVTGGEKKVIVGYYTGDTDFQNGFSDEQRKSGYAYEYYQKIAALTGWDYEYVYGTRNEMIDKLVSGEVDILAGIFKTNRLQEEMLFSKRDMGLHPVSRYFVVNKERKDLLDELNYAMGEIERIESDYPVKLQQKYYSHMIENALTDKEREWLAARSDIRIGYVLNNMPYSDCTESGEADGLVRKLQMNMEEYLQIPFVMIGYENIIDLERALREGEVDAACPIYLDIWLNEEKGFSETNSFISDRVVLIYRGQYTDEMMRQVALCANGIGQRYYLEKYLPDSEIHFYDTRKEILEAITEGRESCTMGSASIYQYVLSQNPKFKELNIAYLDATEDFGMAVRRDNGVLTGILNKAISTMDTLDITTALVRYSSVEPTLTFKYVLNKYAAVFITILFLFLVMIIWGFMIYRRKTILFNREQAKSRLALEEALNTAKHASEAKTTFLSSMSHDIRTPMNAIVGMTYIASQHLDDMERVKSCLEKISMSGRHLLTLINDVLDISKIESGKLALNPAAFSIKGMLDGLREIVEPQAKDKSIELEMRMEDDDYDTVYADEVRINQILMNLLSNAVKYTNPGGKVKMITSKELLQDEKSVRLTFVVRDTGIGMSREFMEHMYETFSRAKDTRIDKIQGTGLGLAIVKQIVDIMDGVIECDSVEGKGTRFVVKLTLPLYEGDLYSEGDAKDAVVDYTSLQGRHLLIAEDNDLNWEVVSELLSMCGITAERAQNGQECVEMISGAEAGKYEAILMDVQMPVMNGLEASKNIRRSDKEHVKNIPIIALTADAYAEDVALAMEAEMNGHVSKPIDINLLLQELQKVL